MKSLLKQFPFDPSIPAWSRRLLQAGRPSPMLAGLIAASMMFVTSCKQQSGPVAPPPPFVVVVEITPTNVPLHTEFIGQLDSPQNVEIRARVEGFVDQMLFIEGTNVNAGDLLFKLDDKPYQERLKAAKGMLGEAQASLKKYEADVARLRPLAEKRAVPQQDLDNALASVDVGKASVVSAQARVDSALLDLSYCEIRAPISGLIGAKQVSIGELVGRGQPTLMATLSTLDPIWFYCNVGEVQYLAAEAEARRTGKRVMESPVTLILSDGSEHPAKGRFVFIDRAVDVKTGTFRVRAEFPNPDVQIAGVARKVLRPGMFGRVRVDLGVRSDSIIVPEKAVTELQGKNFVWVVGSDNMASQRSVSVGPQIGNNLLIADGLKAGERIIVEGLQKARQDQPVQPMTLGQAAEAAAAQAAKQAEARKEKEAKKGASKPAKE
ncbi:MAG TPA: efflux RND transporter periplasmic adaptor subunit [Candidatus Paceibacterota bacterium]|nr:efflux RND transporter periplasmic adaptor subunit [Candidatus Paceibacterota bacterium]